MLTKGIVTSWSGSLGGVTGSHNAGGLYLRARRVPVNPNTALQQAVRSAVTTLTSRWTGSLTNTQRESWDIYAENVPIVGPLGDPRSVSGMNMYIRSNVSRLQVGLARIDDAPTVFTLGDFTAPVITPDTDPIETIQVAFTTTDAWATEVGSSMLIYVGNPQNPGINFYGGPYRFLGRINGAAVAPTSPADFTPPFVIAPGQRIGFFTRVTRVDGRLSGQVRSLVSVL